MSDGGDGKRTSGRGCRGSKRVRPAANSSTKKKRRFLCCTPRKGNTSPSSEEADTVWYSLPSEPDIPRTPVRHCRTPTPSDHSTPSPSVRRITLGVPPKGYPALEVAANISNVAQNLGPKVGPWVPVLTSDQYLDIDHKLTELKQSITEEKDLFGTLHELATLTIGDVAANQIPVIPLLTDDVSLTRALFTHKLVVKHTVKYIMRQTSVRLKDIKTGWSIDTFRPVYMQKNFIYTGCDGFGRPVIVWNVDPDRFTLTETEFAYVRWLSQNCLERTNLDDTGVARLVLIVKTQTFSRKFLAFVQGVSENLYDSHCDVVGQIIVLNTPKHIRYTMAVVKKFLPAESVSRMLLLATGEEEESLSYYLGVNWQTLIHPPPESLLSLWADIEQIHYQCLPLRLTNLKIPEMPELGSQLSANTPVADSVQKSVASSIDAFVLKQPRKNLKDLTDSSPETAPESFEEA